MISRRLILVGTACSGSLLAMRSSTPAPRGDRDAVVKRLVDLERKHGGRLGVAILDSAQPRPITYRGGELFPLCSTFKCLAVACVLARVDGGKESLDRRVVIKPGDLLPYAPVTRAHLGAPGMSVGELCDAALAVSDNTAANLLLGSFGGPQALTAFLRLIGDRVTRLDRTEPTLNEAVPGDPRDSTTPVAMAETLRTLLLGPALSPTSRTRLASGLLACTTGRQRLRAGLPEGWRVGDKTGSGERGTTNDVAIAWPPGRAPVIVTVYLTGSQAGEEGKAALFTEIGRLAGMA